MHCGGAVRPHYYQKHKKLPVQPHKNLNNLEVWQDLGDKGLRTCGEGSLVSPNDRATKVGLQLLFHALTIPSYMEACDALIVFSRSTSPTNVDA